MDLVLEFVIVFFLADSVYFKLTVDTVDGTSEIAYWACQNPISAIFAVFIHPPLVGGGIKR